MKYILISFLTFTTLIAFPQATKKIQEKHKNPWYTEEYYVLKSDKKIRHGNYKKLGYKDCLLINGYYKSNKKDSTWTEYFWRTDVIKSRGSYKEDKKDGVWIEYYKVGNLNTPASKGEYREGERLGIWEFHNQDAALTQKYNYDTQELLYFKPDKEADKEYEIRTENGLKKNKLDKPPMYIGGQDEAARKLSEANLSYPNLAKERGISGTVWISFFIDTKGRATDHQIEEGIGGGCDEEALRAIKEVPDNWLPGQLNGQPVTAKYLFPVKFLLR